MLDDDANRLVLVYGRGGAGKTALACHVLRERELPAVVYLSLRTAECRPTDTVLDGLAAQLADAAPAADLPLAGRLAALRSVAGVDRALVVLDDLEAALDDDNGLGGDLLELVSWCLEHRAAPRLLALSRRALILPADLEGRSLGRRAELDLAEGLEEGAAVDLLRLLDGDGRLGLRDADGALLARAARGCHGMPRSLETLVGTLRQRRTASLSRFLEDARALAAIAEDPARRLHESLREDERRLVRALAVYRRPVPAVALRWMLPDLDVDGIAESLVRSYAASYQRERLGLHPLDSDHAYHAIPQEERVALHDRAAGFWQAARRPPEEWLGVEDAEPLLEEAHHRLCAGRGADAAAALEGLDDARLRRWGLAGRLAELRLRLAPLLVHDPERQLENWKRLGAALRAIGEMRRAVEVVEQALETARGRGDRSAVGRWWGRLGAVCSDLGDHPRALRCHQEALTVARALGERALEGIHLGNLGNACLRAGDLAGAVGYHEAALDIARALGDRDSEGFWLGNLASTWTALGDLPRALRVSEEAAVIARKLEDASLESAWLDNAALACRLSGSLDRATSFGERALALARQVGDRWAIAHRLTSLGETLLHAGDASRAMPLLAEAGEAEAAEPAARAAVLLGLARLARGEDAREALRQGVERSRAFLRVSPRHYAACFQAGLGLAALGLGDEAEKAWREGLDMCREAGVLEELRADLRVLPEASGAPAPSGPRLTTPEGTRVVTREEADRLRASCDLWVDEAAGTAWERTRGTIRFGQRRILGRLLVHLLSRAGAECTPEELVRDVWESAHFDAESDVHTVRVNVSRLRQLIEPDPANPVYVLKTPPRYGRPGGYFFNAQARFGWLRG